MSSGSRGSARAYPSNQWAIAEYTQDELPAYRRALLRRGIKIKLGQPAAKTEVEDGRCNSPETSLHSWMTLNNSLKWDF